MTKTASLFAIWAAVILSATVYAADSPRFRGPAGDGMFPETGLLKQWPEGGPKLAWSVQGLGKGFSSAAVVNGTIYVTGMDDQKQGYLFAFDLQGAPKWKTAYGPEFSQSGAPRPGSRGTPTVEGDQVFVVSSFGKLVMLDSAQGQVLKTVDLLERFKAGPAKFGFAESVLVDGQKVICTPGGPDASVVALDRKTGETIWQTQGLGQPTGYCSARMIRHGDRPMVVTMLEKGAVGIDPATGKVLWLHEYPQRFGVQPNPPLYREGLLYICSGAGAGGTMLALADDDSKVTPQWADKTLDSQIHGIVAVDGCIYGTAQSANKGLVCLDWKTGQVRWNAPEIKSGVVVAADDMLYVYAADGTMYLVQPSAEKFQPVSKFTVTQGTEEHWAHPTIANGRLYIRHGDALLAYDVKGGS